MVALFTVSPRGEATRISMMVGNEYSGFTHIIRRHYGEFKDNIDNDRRYPMRSPFNASLILKMLEAVLRDKKPLIIFETSRTNTKTNEIEHGTERHYDMIGWLLVIVIGKKNQVITAVPSSYVSDYGKKILSKYDQVWGTDTYQFTDESESIEDRIRCAEKANLALNLMGIK